MSQHLSSAAVVIGAIRVNYELHIEVDRNLFSLASELFQHAAMLPQNALGMTVNVNALNESRVIT